MNPTDILIHKVVNQAADLVECVSYHDISKFKNEMIELLNKYGLKLSDS